MAECAKDRYLSCSKVIARRAWRAIRAQDGVRLARPRGRVGRPPGVRVVLGVARDLGALRRARPGRRASTSRLGRQTSASTSAARARPTTPPRARARACARGPRRPRPRRRRRAPSGRPTSATHGGAPAGEPAPVGVADRAQHGERARARRRRAAAAPSAPAGARPSARRRRARSRRAGRRRRRARASRGPAARRSRRRPARRASGAGS